ncbi:hypothetical protein [Salinirussus salinus]|jgi:hypothetical protein|uniref:hypothetical protein n=1 Tax=Salinirussus salinus TaxID=1198300 RepID=UPI0013578082|nr:hypothetical protein [Salinirussus salinus]
MSTQEGLVGAIKIDLVRLHETWMEFIYPRQRGAENTVLGKWTPDGGAEAFFYRLWSAVGVPVVGLVYPLVLLGYFIRFQSRRVNVTAERLGLVGVLLLFVLLWGALSTLVRFVAPGSFVSGGVVAVLAASAVAVVAAGLSYGFWRLGGRVTTVLLAYPFAMTAIFLPPVVAALYSTALADVVLSGTDSLAVWFVQEGPDLFGLTDYLVAEFDLEGVAYVLLWFAIAVPLGWLLGGVVTLADLVRPTPE